MITVTVSSKCQILIPKEIRKKLKIHPGQKLQLFQIGEKIKFVPFKEIKEERGFLKGIDIQINRERDRV